MFWPFVPDSPMASLFFCLCFNCFF
ncbi:DUF1405 domain-containing protein [Bacillus pacificus]